VIAMKSGGNQRSAFAVCINNIGYEASLEVGKLYRVVPDEVAASHGYLRVIDESGEDYGYSVSRFFRIEVPQALEKALTSAIALQTGDIVQLRSARGSRTKFDRALSKVRKTKPRAAERL
jgi:hypothetical protein